MNIHMVMYITDTLYLHLTDTIIISRRQEPAINSAGNKYL